MSQAFTPACLDRRLVELGAPARTPLLCAVSGGADSLALAHALHRLGRPFRIVHVDHQLCAASADWARYVDSLARQWGVSAGIVSVEVGDAGNVEARARTARYAAIAQVARPDECLLTAHHAEDQAATVLLQLLRGAGPAGLAAMPARARRGDLVHLRPLLDVPETALAAYCLEQGLSPVRDPGNEDPRFDRNYLVQRVLPLLRERWPAFTQTLSRSAAHCAEADALLLDLARLDAGELTADAVDLRALRDADPRRQRNALRAWLRVRQIEVPATARFGEFARQLFTAGSDAAPSLNLGDRVLRVHRGVVYESRPAPPPAGWSAPLEPSVPLALPGCAGALEWSTTSPAPPGLEVRFRRGGERFGRSPSTSLKTFLQGHDVLPWRRGEVPLVYLGEQLVAVGDWWQSAQLEGRLAWRPGARFRALGAAMLRKTGPQS